MMYRVLPLFLATLALALFVGTPTRADDDKKAERSNRHEGTVISVTGDMLVMKSLAKDGQEATEHSHKLAANAKVTCDGKECKLEDLKPGQKIRVTTKKGDQKTAVKVEALDQNEKFQKIDKDADQKDNNKDQS